MPSEEEELLAELPHVAEPPKKEPTKLDQFIQRLSQYPDRETAKQHIKDIAKELNCAKSLGYKALKQIDFQGEQKPLEAYEPTAKIPEVKPEPIEEELETEAEVIEAEEAPTPEAAAPPTVTFPMTTEKLSWTFDLAFSKLADLTAYPDFKLSKKESDGLAEAWMPVLQQYAPQMASNPAVWATISTIIIVAPRVIGYWQQRRKKQQEKIVEEPKEKPKEEPKQEPPKQEPTPQTPPPLPKTAGFLDKLK